MRVAVIQMNPVVGDVEGNARRLEEAVAGLPEGVDLAVAPELCLCGYPPRDLLLRPAFIEACRAETERLAARLAERSATSPALVLGAPTANPAGSGRPLHNSALVLSGGRVAASYAKRLLPYYDVFDEHRYFEPGAGPLTLDLAGTRLGLSVCEDAWNDKTFWRERRYGLDPLEDLARAGAGVVVNISASPCSLGKAARREAMLTAAARRHGVWLVYANQVGGNDDLVFDGASLVIGPDGAVRARGAAFAEDLLVVDLDEAAPAVPAPATCEEEEEAWKALVLGTRDYAKKSGFASAVLGLSGGVDSSLTAAVACEALGSENVTGVMMPSPYSSAGSLTDARALADNLGMAVHTLPIEPGMAAYAAMLAPALPDGPKGVTEENIQSRIRGNLLMALSNSLGALLLTTGNKSELAVGYCTIYGDMSGGLAVIADVPKTLVYRVCRRLNAARGELIPLAVLDKAPSAELRPGQKDQDSLPPYEVLDAVLEGLVERHEGVAALVAQGFDPEVVERVARLVAGAEFKRRQAPPGLKVTDRAFGTGWRMPLAARTLAR